MNQSRTYLIIPVSEVSKVDFSLVCETSPETLRKTNDNQKTFIKWEDEQPDFVSSLNDYEGPFSHEEILEILRRPEWNDPSE